VKKVVLILIILNFLLVNITNGQERNLLFVLPQYFSRIKIDKLFIKKLKEKGFKSEQSYYETLGKKLNPLNFSVIILLYPWPRSVNKNYFDENFVSLLLDYLKGGGGILLIPGPLRGGSEAHGTTSIHFNRLNNFLSKLGARCLYEKVIDKKNKKVVKGKGRRYIYYSTTNIVSHPITTGIKKIWYPAGATPWEMTTFTMVLDNHWKVLIKGEKTSASYFIERYGGEIKEGKYKEQPPILAVRNYGKGKFVFFATDGRYWIIQPYWKEFGGVVLEEEGFNLLLNIFNYLTQK